VKKIISVVMIMIICGMFCFFGKNVSSNAEDNATYETTTFKSSTNNSRIEGFKVINNAGYTLSNGTINLPQNSNLRMYTTATLGDMYGVYPADFILTINQKSGTVKTSVRNPFQPINSSQNGIWFSFSGDKVTLNIFGTNTSIPFNMPTTSGTEYKVVISDQKDHIYLYVNGNTIIDIDYYSFGAVNHIKVFDGANNLVGDFENTAIVSYGYCSIITENFSGYLKDVEYSTIKINEPVYTTSETQRIIDYSNWIATDDLDRTTPVNLESRDDKIVGLFYFLCFPDNGYKIVDHTKTFQEQGLDALKNLLEQRVNTYGHYWAEPYFGYYTNVDEWVYRKHAYMLTEAGVDFIFLDVSNAETYREAHEALFDTWLKIRKEGGQTPQICFLTGDDASTLDADLDVLMTTVYSETNYEKYKDLFFMWEGKPLIFANPSAEYGRHANELKNFTVRGSWAWTDQDGYWPWLSDVKQPYGRDFDGNNEQVSVNIAQHATSSIGRSYLNGIQPNNKLNDFEFGINTSKYGYCFDEQFRYALELDPKVIMITGWNEWLAGQFEDGTNYFANTEVDGYSFVDNFNTEFSRDAEPMKLRDGVGFGDNYFYQMISNIRKYKGTGRLQSSYESKTINLSKDISQWDDIELTFMDNIGDTALRHELSFSHEYYYNNNTGRNDFDYAKVTQDNKNVYFMVTTKDDIILDDGSNWMNLYINIDQDSSTGWEGYDFVINRSRTGNEAVVEHFNGTAWEGTNVGNATFSVSGNVMTIAVSRDDLGISGGLDLDLDFKWADNSTAAGNVMEFMDLGDTAPNDRFNYRYSYVFDGDNDIIIYTKDNITFRISIWSVLLINVFVLAGFGLMIYRKRRNGAV